MCPAMYSVFFRGKLVGTTALEYGDPPMGVVYGAIKLNCTSSKESSFLEELGAVVESGIHCIRDSTLRVVGESGNAIPHEGCQVTFEPLSGEAEVELVAIPYPAYRNLFPEHTEKYFGPDT